MNNLNWEKVHDLSREELINVLDGLRFAIDENEGFNRNNSPEKNTKEYCDEMDWLRGNLGQASDFEVSKLYPELVNIQE